MECGSADPCSWHCAGQLTDGEGVSKRSEIGARYAEESPHAILARAPETIKAAEASGDNEKLANAYFELIGGYWLLGKRDQAASMYEKFVTATLEQTESLSWAFSRAVVRLTQFYTTETDARFGDGSQALAMAERLPEYARKAAYFDALASVYARLGQVEKAIHHQKIVVEKCVAAGCCQNYWSYANKLDEYTGRSE